MFATIVQQHVLKVTQVNYVSRNQLHHTANLNLGLMRKKANHCWVLKTNFSVALSCPNGPNGPNKRIHVPNCGLE